MMSRIRKLEKLLPLVYFLFVFCLYFSLLSEAYFTDEQDVFYGGYNIAKGQDLYCSYLTQHMPFSYYMASLIALFGARTIFQYRIGIYLMLSLVWELAWLRHRRKIHPAALWLMPLLYLAMLKTIPLGTSMISDHWQGIGLILILLELVRYAEERTVSTPCAAMVSLGILLSFGTVFIAAYSLLCLFLAMLALQGKHMRERRKTLPDPDFRAERKKVLREDARLVLICLLPFFLLAAWYAVSGNLGNAWDGVYRINTEIYSKYNGGLGSNPFSVLWETIPAYGAYLTGAIRMFPENVSRGLWALVTAAGLIGFCALWGRKSVPAAALVFLATLYTGIREFYGFHGMAYFALAAAETALVLSWIIQRARERKALKWTVLGVSGAAAAVLLADFVIWFGYNLIYPQILLPRVHRAEERVLDLLTEPCEAVHATETPVFSQDVMDLELLPQAACDAVSIPWYYEMWGERQMASIRQLPRVLLYNSEETTWGYVFREYAPDFQAFVEEHYVRLLPSEYIWVTREYLPEAQARLKAAGYGSLLTSTERAAAADQPVKFFPGNRLKQLFTAEGENLSAVYCRVSCYHRRSRPVLRMRVTDPDGGGTAAEAQIGPEELADTFFSRCPLRASLLPGRTYELEIVIEDIGGKGDMEFYFQPDGNLPLAFEYE